MTTPCILIGPDLIERWEDDEDDYYEDDHDWRAWETACVDCGAPGIDCCQCCGGYLCVMHGEVGAGFCRSCPTEDWVNEQEAEARASADREARESR